VPRNRLGGVRGIIRKKRKGRRVKTHDVTQQAKGLDGCPGIWMNLGGSHVERPEDVHYELIKGKRDM